jgi:Raf kinase inhibitor-like YbhB/YbcL family protein
VIVMQLHIVNTQRLALALALVAIAACNSGDDGGTSGIGAGAAGGMTGGIGGATGGMGGVAGMMTTGGMGGMTGGAGGATGGSGGMMVTTGGMSGGATYAPTFDAIFTEIITKGSAGNCTFGACHGAPPTEVNGMLQLFPDDKAMSYAALVGPSSTSMVCGASGKFVVPGDPMMSMFYTKLLDAPPCGARMPFMYPALTMMQLEQIRMWIANGAMNDGGAMMGTGGMGSGGMGSGGMGSGGMGGGMFTLTSSAFTDGGMLPATHRCESLFGAGGPSPDLMWSGAPAGTMSFALTLTDNSNDFAHWTIYDIPAATTSLPMNVMAAAMPSMPAGAKQGANTAPLAGPGYFGPCGGTSNPYEFTLYAIDAATLGVAADADRAAVQAAIDMHDLGSVSITAMSGP